VEGIEAASPERERRLLRIHRPLLLAIYIGEAAAGALGFAWNRYHLILGTVTSRQRAYLAVPAAILATSLVYIARSVFREWRVDARRLAVTVALNAVPMIVALSGGELCARLLTSGTALGPAINGVVLLPKSWTAVRARNLALLEKAPAKISYFVADTLLGWTVGPDRRSTDGIYTSSAEGIRTAEPGTRYASQHVRTTIAVIGDSYAFGLEVPFADTWGARLQQSLGPEFRVLNFGVDGYGVDQAYLRYQRDVRPWHPALTIFSFIEHDLYRSMSVYNFLTFPEWGFPFSKPRFALASGTLELLNVPLASFVSLARERAVGDLPYLDFEPAFHTSEWVWRWYDHSQLVRFVASRFPPYYPDNPRADRKTELRVNLALFAGFAHAAPGEGTVPLIVYLPSRGDYSGQDRSEKDSLLAGLERSGVHYENLTDCLRAAGGERLFIPGHPHYAPSGNAVVSSCLVPVVRSLLRAAAN